MTSEKDSKDSITDYKLSSIPGSIPLQYKLTSWTYKIYLLSVYKAMFWLPSSMISVVQIQNHTNHTIIIVKWLFFLHTFMIVKIYVLGHSFVLVYMYLQEK